MHSKGVKTALVKSRCSIWNFCFSTHLAVEFNEDESHSVRLREVQNAMSPLKWLMGHIKGEIARVCCLVCQLFVKTPNRSNVI